MYGGTCPPTYKQKNKHTHHTHAHRYTRMHTPFLKKERSTTAATKVTVTTPGTETDGQKRILPTAGPSRKGAGWAWAFSVLLHKFLPHGTCKPRSGIFPSLPGSFQILLSSCYPHRLTHRLGLLSIAAMKHHDWKQLGRERVYFTSQLIIHDEGVSAQELKAGTEVEAMGPVNLKLSTLCLCLQVCAATSIHAINILMLL